MKGHISLVIATVFVALASFGQTADKTEDFFDARDVIKSMQKSADWHIENPYPNLGIQEWEMSPYLDGMIALARVSDQPRYWSEVIRLGNSAGWLPNSRKYHADDHAIGHAFLDTYIADTSKKYRLTPFKNHFDSILSDAAAWKSDKSQGGNSAVRTWNWCDALFMAPPTLARLYVITQDAKYLEYMNTQYKWCYDLLWSADDSLFYRDASYIGKKTPNGKKIFWGRGNGWVLAGLAQILQILPANTDNRSFYVNLYKTMAERIVKAQQSDGLWGANLADAEHFKGGETSASGFFTYGLAWGVNNGILDKEKYEPIIIKAWRGLLTRVQESGKVGYVQPVGAAPDAFKKDSTHAYGVGAFLLAGTEVAKMLGTKEAIGDVELLRRAQQIYDASGTRAYACKVPRRKDDLAWENDKMAFRIYGPALEKSIENSGVDVWAKSVSYPVIDKWYDNDLAGKQSYHEDHGEGLDAYKVADLVGLGGTGIWLDGKLYKANVYKFAKIYWTSPDRARFAVYYLYDVNGTTYSERKEFCINVGDDFCEVTSQFFKGTTAMKLYNAWKPKIDGFADDIAVATGLLPQDKSAIVSFDKPTKTLSCNDKLAKKTFLCSVRVSPKTEILEQKKLKSGEEIIIMKPDSKGKIFYKIGYTWGK